MFHYSHPQELAPARDRHRMGVTLEETRLTNLSGISLTQRAASR